MVSVRFGSARFINRRFRQQTEPTAVYYLVQTAVQTAVKLQFKLWFKPQFAYLINQINYKIFYMTHLTLVNQLLNRPDYMMGYPKSK